MSDVGGVPDSPDGYRIGDAERTAAIEALDVHREAGRLDAVEFEDRQVTVSQARTWGEIQPLFSDLPVPHPAGMPGPSAAGPVAARPGGAGVAVPADQQAAPAGLLGSVVPHRYRDTVMALTPFMALLLFFGTGYHWQWFLAIPILGILLYGPGGQEQRKHEQHLARQEQRERRRQDRNRRRGY